MSSRLKPQIWQITLTMGIFCKVANTSVAFYEVCQRARNFDLTHPVMSRDRHVCGCG